MRLLSFVLVAFFGFCLSVSAQNVDVNSVVADPMTFTFNDGKHTVHGYIYSVLEKSTSCCGNDAIYLEVVFDQTGKVISTKTLTGKNDCYKQSVKDIIRNVRWDASGVKSSKTIYFEVRPIIPCSGSGNENVYKPVPLTLDNTSTVASTGGNDDMGDDDMGTGDDDLAVGDDDDMGTGNDDMGTGDDDMGTGDDDDVAVGGDDMGDDDMGTGDDDLSTGDDQDDMMAGDDGGFLSDDPGAGKTTVTTTKTKTETHDDGWANMYDDDNTTANAGDNSNSNVATTKTNTAVNNTKTTTKTAGTNLPNQAGYSYNSTGNKDPDQSHAETFKNMAPPPVATPNWASDESRIAVLIKQSLRRNGVCGLAQSLIELTVDPQGNVINHNILKSNSDQVSKLIPDVLKEVKFQPQPQARFNYVTYIQFKTDIMCQTEAKRPPVDLDTVQDYIIIDK
ncbi:MAG: hypothetical protein H6581_06110 [Bacteroidia bacterium]|nr:hypothetical protein [Bacteroidia bacterium]